MTGCLDVNATEMNLCNRVAYVYTNHLFCYFLISFRLLELFLMDLSQYM